MFISFGILSSFSGGRGKIWPLSGIWERHFFVCLLFIFSFGEKKKKYKKLKMTLLGGKWKLNFSLGEIHFFPFNTSFRESFSAADNTFERFSLFLM